MSQVKLFTGFERFWHWSQAILIFGMLLHKTPICYVTAMARACSNSSGIIFQYPFYAGIMGIMMATGLGKAIAAAPDAFPTPPMEGA